MSCRTAAAGSGQCVRACAAAAGPELPADPESAIAAFHGENEKPTCIILDTLKGKGVSFMENAVDWHGKGPNDEEYEIAMKELNAAYAALEEEDK